MELYVIFDCDAYKTYSSMRLIMVSDKEQIEQNLNNIKQDHGYTDKEMNTYIYVEKCLLNDF